MREIKFRQWNPKTQRMQYDIGASRGKWTSPQYVTWARYPLMQYTGLRDKNNKEIYEGDIVRYSKRETIYKPVYSISGIVKFGTFTSSHEGGYSRNHWHQGFYLADENGNQIWNYIAEDIEWEEVEVLGNIHKNPQLLMGVK